MDPEIVCITKQESPDFVECRFDVDSIAKSSSAPIQPNDIFPRNTTVTSTENNSIPAEPVAPPGLENCSIAGVEMQEELDQTTPSPDELRETNDSGINLVLENEELWTKFRDVHTEMIITKSGRSINTGSTVQQLIMQTIYVYMSINSIQVGLWMT